LVRPAEYALLCAYELVAGWTAERLVLRRRHSVAASPELQGCIDIVSAA